MIKFSRVFSCLLLAAAACGDNHSVGEAPEATLDPAVQTVVNEDGSVSFTIPVQGDIHVMAFAVSTKPAHGAVSGAGPQFLYTPGSDFAGKDSFRITITNMDTKAQTIVPVFIGIDAVNDPPVAHDDQFTTPEDTDLVIPTSAVLANDVDVDSKLTVIAVTQPESPKLCQAAFGCGKPSVTLDGDKITYHPYYNYNGSETFTYTVSDGEYTSTADITVRVTAVNDAPYAFAYSENIGDDKAYKVTVATLVDLRSYDPDGDTTFVAGVSNATGGTVSMDALDGVVTFTPDRVYQDPKFNQTLPTGFDFTISDGHLTATARATFNVEHVNHAPVAKDDKFTLDQDSSVDIAFTALLANDTDPDGDSLYFAGFDSQPSHGHFEGVDEGTFSYVPNEGFVGDDSFTYFVSDGDFVEIATVSLTVKHVNHAPKAKDDMFSTAQDKSLALNVSDLLSNDSDPDDKDTFDITAMTDPEHGTLTWDHVTGAIAYTPSMDGAPADDSFTYTITDAGGLTSTATVYITVGQPNHAPVAQAGSFSTKQETQKDFSLVATDSDMDKLTYAVSTEPMNGTVTIDGSTATYTPASGFTGSDSFEFTASDGLLTSQPAKVTITVDAASSEAPVADPDYDGNYFGSACSSISYDFTVSATDADSETLTFAIFDVDHYGNRATATGVVTKVGEPVKTGTRFTQTFHYERTNTVCQPFDWFIEDDLYWTATDESANSTSGEFDLWSEDNEF